MAKLEQKVFKKISKEDSYNDFIARELWGEILEEIDVEKVIADNASLLDAVGKIKEKRCKEEITEAGIVLNCNEIQKNVSSQIPGNCRIDLSEQLYCDAEGERELGEIVIRFQIMGSESPDFICLNNSLQMDTCFFIGGKDRKGYILSLDTEGKIVCAELISFCLFTLVHDELLNRQSGFFINYHILMGQYKTALFAGWSLEVIRGFILNDWFQQLMKEQGVKDGDEKQAINISS